VEKRGGGQPGKGGFRHTYLREKINLVKFNFVDKGGGQPGKGGSRRRVPVVKETKEAT
jgi:hypothetical protein